MAKPLWAVEAVIEAASHRGLSIESALGEGLSRRVSRRCLFIEGRRCQVVPAPRLPSNPKYPSFVAVQIYVPRTPWPDFIVYVERSENDEPGACFYVVPRDELSKDTNLSPSVSWLRKYRDAWHLLTGISSHARIERRFQVLSTKMKVVIVEAKRRGLRVRLFRRRHRWPTFQQSHLRIEGTDCRVFSAKRLSSNREMREYSYIKLHAPKETNSKILLHVLMGEDGEPPCVYVVPRNRIPVTTTCSVSNPELAQYANAWWNLLTVEEADLNETRSLMRREQEKLQGNVPIAKRRPKPEPPIKQIPWALNQVMVEAERRGLAIKPFEDRSKGVGLWQKCVLIADRPCQVFLTRLVRPNRSSATFVELRLPTSAWPDFLLYVVKPDAEGAPVRFLVLPRTLLSKRTTLSPKNSWLNQYEDAWDLLGKPDSRTG